MHFPTRDQLRDSHTGSYTVNAVLCDWWKLPWVYFTRNRNSLLYVVVATSATWRSFLYIPLHYFLAPTTFHYLWSAIQLWLALYSSTDIINQPHWYHRIQHYLMAGVLLWSEILQTPHSCYTHVWNAVQSSHISFHLKRYSTVRLKSSGWLIIKGFAYTVHILD